MAEIISIEAFSELEQAISAITTAAEENSLLRDPFDEDANVGPFVSPLTEEEKANREKWKEQLKDIQEVLDEIYNEYAARGSADDRFNDPIYQDLTTSVTRIKNALAVFEDRVNKAYASWRQQTRQAVVDDRRETLREISGLVDKFEVFKTEGLSGVSKHTRPSFERALRNFMAGSPELVFASQYVIEGKVIGSLLCFKKYSNATHYEVLKKNSFKSGAEFNRICVLGLSDFEEETKRLMPYVKEVLGFSDLSEDKVLLFLDTFVKQDRIYQYKVKAAKVAVSAAQVDYDLVMESKNMLVERNVPTNANHTLFRWAGTTLGSQDLAWVVALVNEGITFFGRSASEQPLNKIIVDPELTTSGDIRVDVPKNVRDLASILRESMDLHGVGFVFKNIIQVLGGAPAEFINPGSQVPAGFDEAREVFSYDAFTQEVLEEIPTYQLLMEIAETGDSSALSELSKLSIEVPRKTGSQQLSTIQGLSRVLNYMNDTFIAISYAQEAETFEKLAQIRALIEINRSDEDPLEAASTQAREDVATDTIQTGPVVEAQYNVVNGLSVNTDQVVQEVIRSDTMSIFSEDTEERV